MCKVLLLICLLAADAIDSAEPERVTDRSDRAIFTIRVDQKGSSYIIHPDLSRLEAESLLNAHRSNSTSFFYNVTGMAADADAGRASAYETTATANPASKLLLEALLHNINADKSLTRPIEQSTARHTEYVVHNGDAISVEDVTHKVFHAATNRVSIQHHPMANKPEQLIPSSLVKAPLRPSSTSTTHRTTLTSPAKIATRPSLPAVTTTRPTTSRKTTTPSTTTRKMTVPSTTTKQTTTSTTTTSTSGRPEDPNLRLIDSPPDEEQEFYDEEYEDEYEEETNPTVTTTRLTTGPPTVAVVSTNKVVKTSSTRPAESVPPTTEKISRVTYIPLTSVTNKNGILLLAKMNSTIPPVRLPEFVVKTGPSGQDGTPVSSSNLVTKSESTSTSSSSTTSATTTVTTPPSTTKTTEQFDLAQFLVRVAGEASDLLMEPSAPSSSPKPPVENGPQRNIPSIIDGSIFGTLFSSDRSRQEAADNRQRVRPSRPDSSFIPVKNPIPPPQRSGSVHNLNRPGLFSAFNQPPVAHPKSASHQRNGQHPAANLRPIRPVQHQEKHVTPEEVVHHTQPNTDALIPLYSSPGLPATTGIVRVTEPPEVDVITAPSQWNLIVKSSLTSTGQKTPNRVPVPSTSLSHRHGYIVDDLEAAAEAPELPELMEDSVAGDGLLQHQDSPSRLGVAIDYDQPQNPSGIAGSKFETVQPAGRPTSSKPGSDYLSYEDYEDYADVKEAPVTNRTPTSTTPVFIDLRNPPRNPARPGAPQFKPPFPYGVNLGDLTDSREDLSPVPAGTIGSSEELEGFGAAFPEVISNSVRRAGPPQSIPSTTAIPTSQPPRHYLDVEERRPEVYHTEQAIDVFDKKFRTVEVDSDFVNTTTIPHDEMGHSSKSELSGAALTYILIGTFGGLSLLFLCAVGITIRCRKRRFMFSTFTATLMRRSDQRRVDEESQSGSPNVLTGRRMANQQLAAGSDGKEGDVATHKLGSWFTGRNSMSSLHGGSQINGSRKLRAEVALPRTTPNTPGRSSSKVVTRAYFTDGRTGSTRDLITSATASSESSGADTPVHSPGSPHPPDRNSWLHTSYKDRGNSLSELRDSPFYCIAQADGASSDGERPRSTSATVRSPLHHFRSSEDLDSIDPTPPDLPPKRQHRFSVGDSMSGVDPMGSHLTIQTEASVTNNWGTSVDDRLI